MPVTNYRFLCSEWEISKDTKIIYCYVVNGKFPKLAHPWFTSSSREMASHLQTNSRYDDNWNIEKVAIPLS
jgi:hypothetical protein